MSNINTFAMARRLADAATFIDENRAQLSASAQEEASKHTDHLHDAAKIISGDRCAELYIPEETEFVQDEHYRSIVAIDRSSTGLNFSHWRKNNGEVALCIYMGSGAMDMRLYPSPTECRALAAALKQLADDAEASAAQVAHKAPELAVSHG